MIDQVSEFSVVVQGLVPARLAGEPLVVMIGALNDVLGAPRDTAIYLPRLTLDTTKRADYDGVRWTDAWGKEIQTAKDEMQWVDCVHFVFWLNNWKTNISWAAWPDRFDHIVVYAPNLEPRDPVTSVGVSKAGIRVFTDGALNGMYGSTPVMFRSRAVVSYSVGYLNDMNVLEHSPVVFMTRERMEHAAAAMAEYPELRQRFVADPTRLEPACWAEALFRLHKDIDNVLPGTATDEARAQAVLFAEQFKPETSSTTPQQQQTKAHGAQAAAVAGNNSPRRPISALTAAFTQPNPVPQEGPWRATKHGAHASAGSSTAHAAEEEGEDDGSIAVPEGLRPADNPGSWAEETTHESAGVTAASVTAASASVTAVPTSTELEEVDVDDAEYAAALEAADIIESTSAQPVVVSRTVGQGSSGQQADRAALQSGFISQAAIYTKSMLMAANGIAFMQHAKALLAESSFGARPMPDGEPVGDLSRITRGIINLVGPPMTYLETAQLGAIPAELTASQAAAVMVNTLLSGESKSVTRGAGWLLQMVTTTGIAVRSREFWQSMAGNINPKHVHSFGSATQAIRAGLILAARTVELTAYVQPDEPGNAIQIDLGPFQQELHEHAPRSFIELMTLNRWGPFRNNVPYDPREIKDRLEADVFRMRVWACEKLSEVCTITKQEISNASLRWLTEDPVYLKTPEN